MLNSDEIAKQTLTQLGFIVEKLPEATESGKKMPDFFVRYGSSSALVEAKLKVDDPDQAILRENVLTSGEAYVSDHVLGRNETLSGIVRNGSKQLKAAIEFEADFNVIFFLMNCINARAVREQLVDTLYGRTMVMEYGKPSQLKACYFYRNSDFYRRQEIDAAIVGYSEANGGDLKFRICLNPYSPHHNELKASEFLLPFGPAVTDPISEEQAGLAYIPDAGVERREQNFMRLFSFCDPVLLHLAAKYGTAPLVRLDFNAPEISIRSR
ncbi:hypothetical protein [Stenotrophomonas pigmentata]|uniref:hypothetical protein n=1 Tax=Stenotrophomonas pigmentata TaxID=3055080 RepID=UPI0026EE837D|nr:hypothetical protein [Stenotrophomonas sp. 610A2]